MNREQRALTKRSLPHRVYRPDELLRRVDLPEHAAEEVLSAGQPAYLPWELFHAGPAVACPKEERVSVPPAASLSTQAYPADR